MVPLNWRAAQQLKANTLLRTRAKIPPSTSLAGEDVVAVDRPAGVRSNLTHSCLVEREGQDRWSVVPEEFDRG